MKKIEDESNITVFFFVTSHLLAVANSSDHTQPGGLACGPACDYTVNVAVRQKMAQGSHCLELSAVWLSIANVVDYG